MNFIIKRAFILLIWINIFFGWYPDKVTATPNISVGLPSSIKVHTGENFAIPVTVTSKTYASSINAVWAFPESADITVDSQNIPRFLPVGSSMQAILTGRARAPGFYRVRIDVEYIVANVAGRITNDVLVEVSDRKEQVARPRLSIPRVTFVPEKPDLTAPFTLNVPIQNIGNAAARDLVVTFNGGENFSVTTLTNRVHLPSVEPGATATATFQVRALNTRGASVITLDLAYGAHTQTETLNLPLPAAVAQKQQSPLLKVSSFSLRPAQNDRFILNLIIQNTGAMEARDIRVSLDGGDRAFPVGGGKTRRIPSIAPYATATVEYLLTSRGELSTHPLNIAFNFSDPNGKEGTNNDRIFISSNLEPSIKITGFSAKPKGDKGEFLFNMQLQNKGRSLARDISVRFAGTQAFPLDGSSLVLVPNLAAAASSQLSLLMKAGAKSEVYSIPVEITYRSGGGAEHKTSETIVLSSAAIGIVTTEQAGTPRVMLERHTLSTNQVLAGNTFTLTLYIKNNADRAVVNTKISLASVQAGGGAGGTGGIVFSTLDGGGSSFFVDRIAANGQLVKKVTLFVDPNAAAMTYTLPITIEYEDGDGKPFSVSEAVNIPILQKSSIRVLSVDIPTAIMAGQAVPVSMEFANTGRVALNSVLVAIEGDFPKENATFFIPKLEIGMSDFFQGMIIPAIEGTLSGNLAITFLDSHNQEVRIDHPFTIEVQAMEQLLVDIPGGLDPGGAGFPGTGQISGFPWINIIAGAVAAVAIILAAIVLMAKKIRARRQKTFFDEN